jgi:hypothetical protein
MDTKTGSRRVPIASSLQSLKEWVEEHPYKDNPNSPLWVQLQRHRDEPLDYKGLADMVRVLRKRAGIKKRIHFYLFRYTSYNTKANAGWSEAKIKAFHGLDQGSKILGTYILGVKEEVLMDDILALAGKKVVKRNEQKKEFVVCPRCQEETDADKKRCHKCAFVLDLEEAQGQIESSEKKFKDMEDAMFRRLEEKMMKKLGK